MGLVRDQVSDLALEGLKRTAQPAIPQLHKTVFVVASDVRHRCGLFLHARISGSHTKCCVRQKGSGSKARSTRGWVKAGQDYRSC